MGFRLHSDGIWQYRMWGRTGLGKEITAIKVPPAHRGSGSFVSARLTAGLSHYKSK